MDNQWKPRYAVRIDRWHPTRLNQLINSHWAVANRMKKQDAFIIAAAVRGAGVREADCKRRVDLEITLAPRQRAGDPDAYWKVVLDSLVKCGALRNDSHVWCVPGSVTFQRGETMATVIILQDLETAEAEEAGAVQRAKKKRHRLAMDTLYLV